MINAVSAAGATRGVIIHYHLFKNAGTSIDAILRRNFQTQRLAMAEPANGDTECARTLRAFGRLPFIGSVEAFEASLAELERVVKPWFPEFRVFQARENVSRPPRPIEERIAALKAELGDELFETVSAANADDLDLYDRALARYSTGSEKTPAKPGDEVAAGKLAGEFTPEEFQTLIRLARRAVRADWETRRSIQTHGINIVPANYYSDLPTIAELESSFEFADPQGPYRSPGVFDTGRLASFLKTLDQYAEEFDPPQDGDPQDPTGFFWRNPAFSYSDAVAYYCVLRHLKPAHVLEVGSGFSTFVAIQAIERNGSGRISCIEPFPRPWRRQLEQRATIHQQRVQEFDADFFNSQLTDSDVLFIDSTHTVKAGSDCLHIYLRILPELTSKVTVHAHDIYLPFPQPRRHAEQQIYWTEQYLLYAYLLQNPIAKVVYGSRYHHAHNRAGLEKLMRGRYPSGGGSFWFTLNQG